MSGAKQVFDLAYGISRVSQPKPETLHLTSSQEEGEGEGGGIRGGSAPATVLGLVR